MSPFSSQKGIFAGVSGSGSPHQDYLDCMRQYLSAHIKTGDDLLATTIRDRLFTGG